MASANTRQYDPGQINVALSGAVNAIVTGYADGTFVDVERNVDMNTLVVGADGENTRVTSQNRSGKITLTLQQSSPTNDVLTALADATESGAGGVVGITVKDGNGSTLVSAKQAWVVKRAKTAFGKDLENREWQLESGNLVLQVGGAVDLS